ncbi:serine protease inhibitor [Dendrothele bispora CBS 962.96]|uniref:Serine protease inhibitor n=1 Tax=Dendrothele bispora (strain CBS 962.96) TaxID=1314807 RepID=A0A4S8LKU0_DENBC|nr:serine protease inhibitor [Dendrothele bispora CBS 962.96]THU89590.1 serine protease inhibitor [Dendrothele bispora CBS 962.96]
MSLESGIYTIRNRDNNVGRSLTEDRSLGPKRILLLPQDVKPEEIKWEIEKLDHNSYTLKIRDAPTANIDNLVFALLINKGEAEKWRIEAVPQHGENRYIITTQDKKDGWVAPDAPDEQIICKPLTATKSQPPQYLPTEFYEIVLAAA